MHLPQPTLAYTQLQVPTPTHLDLPHPTPAYMDLPPTTSAYNVRGCASRTYMCARRTHCVLVYVDLPPCALMCPGVVSCAWGCVGVLRCLFGPYLAPSGAGTHPSLTLVKGFQIYGTF